MWTALATELGYSWQRIEQIEAIARPRERALKREQEEAENNANDLIIREERKYA
jgi:hypothetical protein